MVSASATDVTDLGLLTEQEKVLFDLKGWLVFPGVLNNDEIALLRSQIERMRTDPDSLAPGEGEVPGGALSVLIDHPATMRVLRSIIESDVDRIRMEGGPH